MSDTSQPTTAPSTNRSRTVLVAITAHAGGIVIVSPPSGDPRALTGESARVLHELAMDTSIPVHTIEPGAGFADRALQLVGRLLTDGAQ